MFPPLLRLASIDARSLGAFRIGFGTILLVDLARRALDLEAHYSDRGVLPRAALLEWSSSAAPDLHLTFGSPWGVGLLFALAAAFAAALALGWRTRIAAVGSWLLLVSLQARNPMVIHGGDLVLRALAFWAIFLPLGRAWSLDARRQDHGDRGPVLSVASLAMLLQVAFIYWFTVAHKWHPAWTRDFTAIYLALHLDQLSTAFGRLLLGLPLGLLKAATAATLAFEALAPTLVFSPWKTAFFRTWVPLAAMAFHLVVLAPALDLGSFPWICAVAWTLFLPAEAWDRILPRLARAPGASSLVERVRERTSPLVPTASPAGGPGGRRLRAGVQAGLAILLLYTTLWNLRNVDSERWGRFLPSEWNWVGEVTGLAQWWTMFSPYPSLEDGWFVAPGQLADGQEVDVLTGEAVTWDNPASVTDRLGGERWKKYTMNLWEKGYRKLRLPYGQYLCRRWNESHPPEQALEQFRLYFALELTVEPGEPEPPLRRLVALHHVCVPDSTG